jgi:hypothetical protein
MTISRDLLAPKEITRQELKDLVDGWVAEGHTIRQCAPGVALNFRSKMGDANDPPRHKRSPSKSQRRRSDKPVKKKGKS